MAGGLDDSPGAYKPISHPHSDLVTLKILIPASAVPQPMVIATCYLWFLPDMSMSHMEGKDLSFLLAPGRAGV